MKSFALFFILIIVFSCSLDDPQPREPILGSLVLETSADTIIADGTSEIRFDVTGFDFKNDTIHNINYRVYVNGQPIITNQFITTQVGEYKVEARSGEVVSNEVIFKAVHKPVDSINLVSNTQLIIADSISTASLLVTLYDENGDTVNTDDYDLYVNYSQHSGMDFRTNLAGDYIFYAKTKDLESNRIIITARENKMYDEISIPIIFHIARIDMDLEPFSSSEVTKLVDELNQVFSNQAGSTNPNAVDTKIQFRLAKYDTLGNELPEHGIHRIDATKYDTGGGNKSDIFGDQKLGSTESLRFGKETFWDPRMYLNIWLYPSTNRMPGNDRPLVYESQPLAGLMTVPDDCDCTPSSNFYPWLGISTSIYGGSIYREVGFALGLLHILSFDDCLTSDYCEDTYSYFRDASGTEINCPDNKGSLEDDSIVGYRAGYTITFCQRERMRHVLEHGVWFKDLKNSDK